MNTLKYIHIFKPVCLHLVASQYREVIVTYSSNKLHNQIYILLFLLDEGFLHLQKIMFTDTIIKSYNFEILKIVQNMYEHLYIHFFRKWYSH